MISFDLLFDILKSSFDSTTQFTIYGCNSGHLSHNFHSGVIERADPMVIHNRLGLADVVMKVIPEMLLL